MEPQVNLLITKNNGAEKASIAYDGEIKGKTIDFNDFDQSLVCSNSYGFRASYNNLSNIISAITCDSTGILLTYDINASSNFIHIGESFVGINSDVYCIQHHQGEKI